LDVIDIYDFAKKQVGKASAYGVYDEALAQAGSMWDRVTTQSRTPSRVSIEPSLHPWG